MTVGGHTLGAAGPGQIRWPGSGAPLPHCPNRRREGVGTRRLVLHHGRPSWVKRGCNACPSLVRDSKDAGSPRGPRLIGQREKAFSGSTPHYVRSERSRPLMRPPFLLSEVYGSEARLPSPTRGEGPAAANGDPHGVVPTEAAPHGCCARLRSEVLAYDLFVVYF